VPAVAPTRAVRQIWECRSIRGIVDVHAVPQSAADIRVEARERRGKHAPDNQAKRDIGHVVEDAPAVRETGWITAQQAKPARTGGGRGGHARIQSEQVGNWTSWRAHRGNGWRVGHHRKQIEARH